MWGWLNAQMHAHQGMESLSYVGGFPQKWYMAMFMHMKMYFDCMHVHPAMGSLRFAVRIQSCVVMFLI